MVLMAQWCRRFSPVVAVDPDPAGHLPDHAADGLLLDVTGEAHLFGGEHLLLMEIATRLRRMGVTTRLAIAPTLGAAWALARFGCAPAAIVSHDKLRHALQPLPVAALRLPAAMCGQLQEVSIEHIGHLLKLPREHLFTRFGNHLLLRLDQAFGAASELIEPCKTRPPLQARRMFDGATIQIEAIILTVQDLLAELTQQLLLQESGVRSVRLQLLRVNAPPVWQEFVLGRPTRDPVHLWKIMRPKVESIHMGYGADGITLTASGTQTISHQQTHAWATGAAEAQQQHYALFLDTLTNRWGNNRVLAAHAVASHVPEIARNFQPAGPSPQALNGALLPVDRPSLLFDRPQTAEGMALQPDHPPSWIRWQGREYVLRSGTGPERIVTTWRAQATQKHKAPSTRDYFKVQTPDAAWLWVFRELETGRWFVHGLWA
jgi:protein ImuB